MALACCAPPQAGAVQQVGGCSTQGMAEALHSEMSLGASVKDQSTSPNKGGDARLKVRSVDDEEEDDNRSHSNESANAAVRGRGSQRSGVEVSRDQEDASVKTKEASTPEEVVSRPSMSPIIREIKTDQVTGDVSICLGVHGEEHCVLPDNGLEVRVTISGKPGEVQNDSSKDAKVSAPTFNVPLLVRTVGAVLACAAGLVNSVAFFELGSFVSHQTGTFSKVGFGDMDALGVLLSFLGGSIACGLIISKDDVHIGLALYDFGLLGIAGLLVAATLSHHEPHAKYFAAAACGLQNSMATFWGGTVVRTTHVTGLFTDLGLLIGRLGSQFVRVYIGHRPRPNDRVEIADNLRKGSFLGTLAVSFLLGIIIGKHVHESIHEYAFLLPAGVAGVLGVAYMINRVVILKQRLFSVP